MEEKLPRAVPLVRNFSNWKERMTFFLFSCSCLIYSLCGKEMRIEWVEEKDSTGTEHFYFLLPLWFWKTGMKLSILKNAKWDGSNLFCCHLLNHKGCSKSHSLKRDNGGGTRVFGVSNCCEQPERWLDWKGKITEQKLSAQILTEKTPARLGTICLDLQTRNILEKCSWHLWSRDGYLETTETLRCHWLLQIQL